MRQTNLTTLGRFGGRGTGRVFPLESDIDRHAVLFCLLAPLVWTQETSRFDSKPCSLRSNAQAEVSPNVQNHQEYEWHSVLRLSGHEVASNGSSS